MSGDLDTIGSEISTALSDLLLTLKRAERIAAESADKASTMAEPFIGKREAAAFLDIAVSTLERRMAESDGPPRYTDGGKVSFRRSELLVWRRQWRAGDQTGIQEPTTL